MIKAFVVEQERLRQIDDFHQRPEEVVWLDLLSPTKDEEIAVENLLAVGVPTREEMEEIEISSRLYVEDGNYFMTATLPAHAEGDERVMAPVTFVLANNRLITIRYHEPRAFQTFPMRAEKVSTGCIDGETILVGLLEAVVDRLADIIEGAGRGIDEISVNIFQSREKHAASRDRDFKKMLQQIGRKEELTSNLRDSLASLQRLSGFLGHAASTDKSSKDVRARIKTLSRDVQSLADHLSFLQQKITFLLDATLGMISIEQAGIIKIFSVAAVVFLPPTLVASNYGMNFDVMPELHWLLGYPFAIGMMFLSGLVPYLYFKRRGWL
ncbi:magnesium/cobalt transporter CorA [Mesorhizobium sp. NBSH29]|uniref:magnesium/cobalt transporter CorA n=1 Tax=Mesorhizobium sp. NBSH29 TaxID=2654249 RepID=UPI00189661CC|nr:magnesium/cobalt transporter CorA [Mesorhizobium sp. NBSH29]QPC85297.1 magnesium/cobalt transporter CorA [Mesorhizobium sp. NBSH29]